VGAVLVVCSMCSILCIIGMDFTVEGQVPQVPSWVKRPGANTLFSTAAVGKHAL
jgi:hypothetical protein